MAIKATARSGRAGKFGVYNANHNTLEATRAQESHIDHERTMNNKYAYWDEDRKGHKSEAFNAKEHELKMYEHFFGDSLKAQNERYIKDRHPERCREMRDILTNVKTAPFETLFQIDKEGSTVASPEQLWRIANQTIAAMAKKSNGHFQPLDLALHLDETTGHIHARAVFMAKNSAGQWTPNQNAALKEMGFERPNPDKPLNRYNNPLISFSDALRNDFYDRCEREGIEIDRTVKNPSKRHLEALEFKSQKLEASIAEKDAQIQELKDKLERQQHLSETLNRANKKSNARYEANKENLDVLEHHIKQSSATLGTISKSIKDGERQLASIQADKEHAAFEYQQLVKATEALMKKQTKKTKGPFKKEYQHYMNNDEYCELCQRLQAVEEILKSPVYTPQERTDMLRAKHNYEQKEAKLDKLIDERAESKAQLIAHKEKNRITQLENKLKIADHNYDFAMQVMKQVCERHHLDFDQIKKDYKLDDKEHKQEAGDANDDQNGR